MTRLLPALALLAACSGTEEPEGDTATDTLPARYARYAGCTAVTDIDWNADGIIDQREDKTYTDFGKPDHWTHSWLESGTVYTITLTYNDGNNVLSQIFDFGDSVIARRWTYDGEHVLYRDKDEGDDGVIEERILYETDEDAQIVGGEHDLGFDGVIDGVETRTWADGLEQRIDIDWVNEATVDEFTEWTWEGDRMMSKERRLGNSHSTEFYSHDDVGRIIGIEVVEEGATEPTSLYSTTYDCP